MIDFQMAVGIAQRHYKENGNLKISKVYEGKNLWLFFASNNGKPTFDEEGIAITKVSGEIKPFDCSTIENYKILDSAKLLVT